MQLRQCYFSLLLAGYYCCCYYCRAAAVDMDWGKSNRCYLCSCSAAHYSSGYLENSVQELTRYPPDLTIETTTIHNHDYDIPFIDDDHDDGNDNE